MNYGLSCVMGNFGSGKTYGTFMDIFDLDKDENYIIANVPYSVVDHYYSSTADLLKVFEVLGKYAEETNKDLKKVQEQQKRTKNIVLVVDEAHLYLGARESLTKASILGELKTIFTQCRKRKIRILFITQRLTQIDIYVRRLSDFVEEYHFKRWLLFPIHWVKKTVYENKGDVADIETDSSIKITSDGEAVSFKEDSIVSKELFLPLTSLFDIFQFLNPTYRRMLKEEEMTLHICGYNDVAVQDFTYENFIKNIVIPAKDKKKISFSGDKEEKKQHPKEEERKIPLPPKPVFKWTR